MSQAAARIGVPTLQEIERVMPHLSAQSRAQLAWAPRDMRRAVELLLTRPLDPEVAREAVRLFVPASSPRTGPRPIARGTSVSLRASGCPSRGWLAARGFSSLWAATGAVLETPEAPAEVPGKIHSQAGYHEMVRCECDRGCRSLRGASAAPSPFPWSVPRSESERRTKMSKSQGRSTEGGNPFAAYGGNWPSKTGNPSGGGRGNNPPRSKK